MHATPFICALRCHVVCPNCTARVYRCSACQLFLCNWAAHCCGKDHGHERRTASPRIDAQKVPRELCAGRGCRALAECIQPCSSCGRSFHSCPKHLDPHVCVCRRHAYCLRCVPILRCRTCDALLCTARQAQCENGLHVPAPPGQPTPNAAGRWPAQNLAPIHEGPLGNPKRPSEHLTEIEKRRR